MRFVLQRIERKTRSARSASPEFAPPPPPYLTIFQFPFSVFATNPSPSITSKNALSSSTVLPLYVGTSIDSVAWILAAEAEPRFDSCAKPARSGTSAGQQLAANSSEPRTYHSPSP